jgi:predicted DsbA family dithiol-disulfide isomerase
VRGSAPPVELFVDVVCPYSYLLAAAALAQAGPARLRWHLVPLSAPPPDAPPAERAMHAARRDAAWPEIVALATAQGLALARPDWTIDGRAAAAASSALRDASPEALARLHVGLFEATIADRADVGDPAVVGAVVRAAGLTLPAADAEPAAIARSASAAVAAAAARGIVAVPALVSGDRMLLGAQPPGVVARALQDAGDRGPGPAPGVSLSGAHEPPTELA